MRKPGKVLSIIGLILSAALLVVGSYFILPRSQNWASIWSVLTGTLSIMRSTKEIKIELRTAERPSAVKKSLTTGKSADILIELKTK